MKITKERERGIIMELSTTLVEWFKVILLYFCIPYIDILYFYVCDDIISNGRCNFSKSFVDEVIDDFKEKQIHPTQNSFLYLLRSISYVIGFVLIFETGYNSKNYILYIPVLILLILSKLFKESYLKKIYIAFINSEQTQQKTTSKEKDDV